jgi:type II secretory pathway pseudopilin PulG
LVELATVLLLIGILSVISIPNYMAFARKAKDAAVKENMHVIQSGMEAYAAAHDGVYPTQNEEADLLDMLPDGNYPINPYTQAPTVVVWNANPAQPGEIGIFNLPGGGYLIVGRGSKGLLSHSIQMGD